MCANGILSFRSVYTTALFTDITKLLIAPFGIDINIEQRGNIFYRTLNASEQPSNLQQIISYAFPISGFELRQVFVATYDRVPPFSGNTVSL